MGSCSGILYGNNHYSIGLCSMRGCRKKMENSHSVYLSIPGHPSYSLFAVFDGFNGNEASKYLSNNLINTLSKLKKLNDDNIIIDAIKKMDKRFLKLQNINNAGSTIVFALIKPLEIASNFYSSYIPYPEESDRIQNITTPEKRHAHFSFEKVLLKKFDVSIFWVGDSRSTLITNTCKDNEYETLTIDHRCSLETEKKRIIINNKINGMTELSRSFGCHSMKNNKKLKYNQQKLLKHVCIVNVTHKICQSNETLLLHCDGLIEKWNTKQLVSKYKHHYNQCKDYKNPMQNALHSLCKLCIDDGSTDNITVIAVQFK